MARSSPDTSIRSSSRGNAWRAASALAALAAGLAVFAQGQKDDALRVCADPSNLPLSNTRGEGYENKIAELLARDLKRHVEFTFFPQRMGFVRNTLRLKDDATQQFKCDVIIGVPKGFELTATTQPYMRSTYALVFRERGEFAPLRNWLHDNIHIHGQRFLVLAVNGTPNENPVWKDTVLLPAAGALDLLVDMSNPGSWMLHCHIAEHLQAGMMMHFDVGTP